VKKIRRLSSIVKVQAKDYKNNIMSHTALHNSEFPDGPAELEESMQLSRENAVRAFERIHNK
jgi:hypothetical protein